mgnify:CR=1 FL=1
MKMLITTGLYQQTTLFNQPTTSKKMLLSILILSVFICVATSTVGFLQYYNTISELYNAHGYTIGDINERL